MADPLKFIFQSVSKQQQQHSRDKFLNKEINLKFFILGSSYGPIINKSRRCKSAPPESILYLWIKSISNFKNGWDRGSGCGLVARAVTCDTRGSRFESNHRQYFIWNISFIVNSTKKTKKRRKRPRMVHVKKTLKLVVAVVASSPHVLWL